MHTPSPTFLKLIDDAGSVRDASVLYDVPQATLFCVRNGTRRMGRGLAEKLEERSCGGYSAADLLGLGRPVAASVDPLNGLPRADMSGVSPGS